LCAQVAALKFAPDIADNEATERPIRHAACQVKSLGAV
jgi:hypothetical protein